MSFMGVPVLHPTPWSYDDPRSSDSRCGTSRNTAARFVGQDGVMRRSIQLLVALTVSVLVTGGSQAPGPPAPPAASPALGDHFPRAYHDHVGGGWDPV